MIYAFAVGGWLKVGFTRQSPWARLVCLSAAKHPPALCRLLKDFNAIRLVDVWEADKKAEKDLHALLEKKYTKFGEFYEADPGQLLAELRASLGDPLPPFRRPTPEQLATFKRKIALPCCSGKTVVCFRCGKQLASWKGLTRHQQKKKPCKPRAPC
jgi:hypothetical protein